MQAGGFLRRVRMPRRRLWNWTLANSPTGTWFYSSDVSARATFTLAWGQQGVGARLAMPLIPGTGTWKMPAIYLPSAQVPGSVCPKAGGSAILSCTQNGHHHLSHGRPSADHPRLLKSILTSTPNPLAGYKMCNEHHSGEWQLPY